MMKIYTTGPDGELALQNGRSIVVEFADGKTLELAGSPQPLPPEIPAGFYIWGGRAPNEASRDVVTSRLDITPAAANGINVSPHGEKSHPVGAITLSIADEQGGLRMIENKKAVLELGNGKTVEVMEDYAQQGLLIWGGREPNPDLPFEEMKARTESLGIYFVAANVVHLFPYQLASN